MARDSEDDIEAIRALDEWLRERPAAGIVVAAIDERPDGELEVALRLGALNGYQLLGLVQALVDHTMTVVAETPGSALSPEYETLYQVQALLNGGARKLN